MKKIGIAIGVIVVALLGFGLDWAWKNFTVDLPNYPVIANTVWLDQNWTPNQRDWYHNADQGTQTFGIPYEWFIALEQPAPSITAPGLLSDPKYLDRYGFISSNTNSGKTELPIGFAHGGTMHNPDGTPWRNPQTGVEQTGVGLTCAACHTGRFTYKNTSVLIDGGPALLNLADFQKGAVLSLLYTRYMPFRFDRFADRVLGPGAGNEAKSALRKQLDLVVSQALVIKRLQDNVKHQTVTEGYARLDALNRIGDFVFAVDLLNSPGFNSANFVGYSAPVHYPRIWNASWFQWVQYNGSIQQPMTRNAGEALGVLAQVNLTSDKQDLYSSSVRIEQLFEIEQLLAGRPPTDAPFGFKGLTSPKWPEVLPPINTDRAAKGAELYKELCQSCHMAPVTDSQFWISDRWSPTNSAGERYLNLEQIDIKHIGTDPAQAEDMSNRKIVTPPSLGIKSDEFGVALGQVVDNTVNHWYDHQLPPVPTALREKMNGNRPMGVRALLSYKVRPLNGIWATPPYLHNASVPNLYALLSPVAERPKKFYLGNREYDPVNVGYRIDALPGGFEFDTSKRGNSNSGHEFVTGTSDAGVIGRYLSPDERLALIEYLKTL
jgi:hypothetical protein